jgi:4-diphosphocytidyl-2-C-methyl-D-erythritol kinase
MPTTVRSHAKINLGLYIGGPRPDGFHGLTTVYQTLEIHDIVTVTAKPAAATTIRLTSNDRRVPTDNRNTAWKMVELALAALEIQAEVEIAIDKRLPVQGGMGAGSANAVAALVGLENELGIRETGVCGFPGPKIRTWGPHGSWSSKRLQIAAQVGSDVPLFLTGGTSLGLDRGQVVIPLPDIEPVWCVVALPEVGVSTAQAFRDWDALCLADGLTPQASTDKLEELSRAYASAFACVVPKTVGLNSEGWSGAGSSGILSEELKGENLAGPQGPALVRTGICSWIGNDFERVVFPQQPSLGEIKRLLASPDTPEASLVAMLSGSGSALFGLYLAREAADAACNRLEAAGVRCELTRTLSRAEYWRQMLQSC